MAFIYSRGPQVVFLFGAGSATQTMIEGAGAEEIAPLVLGTFLIGVIPAGAGCGFFFWGLRRLNRA